MEGKVSGEKLNQNRPYLRAVEDVEQAEDKTAVPVVSDTTSIITLPCQVAQSFQRRLIIPIDEHLMRGSIVMTQVNSSCTLRLSREIRELVGVLNCQSLQIMSGLSRFS